MSEKHRADRLADIRERSQLRGGTYYEKHSDVLFLLVEVDRWKEEALKQARLYTEKNEKAHHWQEQAEKLFETVETAISELKYLERSLKLPEQGYDRNNFNRVMRTLKEGVKKETREKLFDEIAERELKFRLYEFKSMEYFDLDDVYYNRVKPSNGVYDVPIMQYTGINDRNGKEIYEGDILMVTNDADEVLSTSADTGVGIVEWLHDFWNVKVIEKSLYDLTRSGYVEVIGNKIENANIIAEEFRDET